MTEKLLSEYQNVLKELEIIKNRITVIKDVTEDRIKGARNNKEKECIFTEFKNQLNKIKHDKKIKYRYKELKKKKEFIESEMMCKMSEKSSSPKKNHNTKTKNHKKSKNIKSSSESSSSHKKHCVKKSSNVCVDIDDMISKYKKNISIVQSDTSHKSKTSSSSSCSSDSKSKFKYKYKNNAMDNKLFVMSDSSKSDNVDKRKKKCKQKTNDDEQMKKLYSLIDTLKCEIDE